LNKLPGGGSRYVFRYRISAFRVGTYILPPIQVAYQGPGGERGVSPTGELPIVVGTVIRPGESTDDVKPLKPQLRLPGAPPDLSGAVRVALVLVVALMLVLLVVQTRRAMARRAAARPPEPEAQLTPAQRALAELARVSELPLPEKGRCAARPSPSNTSSCTGKPRDGRLGRSLRRPMGPRAPRARRRRQRRHGRARATSRRGDPLLVARTSPGDRFELARPAALDRRPAARPRVDAARHRARAAAGRTRERRDRYRGDRHRARHRHVRIDVGARVRWRDEDR